MISDVTRHIRYNIILLRWKSGDWPWMSVLVLKWSLTCNISPSKRKNRDLGKTSLLLLRHSSTPCQKTPSILVCGVFHKIQHPLQFFTDEIKSSVGFTEKEKKSKKRLVAVWRQIKRNPQNLIFMNIYWKLSAQFFSPVIFGTFFLFSSLCFGFDLTIRSSCTLSTLRTDQIINRLWNIKDGSQWNWFNRCQPICCWCCRCRAIFSTYKAQKLESVQYLRMVSTRRFQRWWRSSLWNLFRIWGFGMTLVTNPDKMDQRFKAKTSVWVLYSNLCRTQTDTSKQQREIAKNSKWILLTRQTFLHWKLHEFVNRCRPNRIHSHIAGSQLLALLLVLNWASFRLHPKRSESARVSFQICGYLDISVSIDEREREKEKAEVFFDVFLLLLPFFFFLCFPFFLLERERQSPAK